MDPDDAAAGPVGELVRVRARAEGERPIDRAAKPVQLLTDPRVTARRGRRALRETDGRLEDLLAVLVERDPELAAVDYDLSADQVEHDERLARVQALPPVQKTG